MTNEVSRAGTEEDAWDILNVASETEHVWNCPKAVRLERLLRQSVVKRGQDGQGRARGRDHVWHVLLIGANQ